MLSISVLGGEYWDEINEMFIQVEPDILRLEHSLASVAKWEARWNKPFLTRTAKTIDETIDYIRCMTENDQVDPLIYNSLTDANIREVMAYIDLPMTATTIRDDGGPPSRRVITAEVIYSWMASLGIPSEYQYWHLNRLITLIRVCDIERRPPKKMSANALASRNSALNEARKKKYHTRG